MLQGCDRLFGVKIHAIAIFDNAWVAQRLRLRDGTLGMATSLHENHRPGPDGRDE